MTRLSAERLVQIRQHLDILETCRAIGPDTRSDILADDLRDLLAEVAALTAERDRLLDHRRAAHGGTERGPAGHELRQRPSASGMDRSPAAPRGDPRSA